MNLDDLLTVTKAGGATTGSLDDLLTVTKVDRVINANHDSNNGENTTSKDSEKNIDDNSASASKRKAHQIIQSINQSTADNKNIDKLIAEHNKNPPERNFKNEKFDISCGGLNPILKVKTEEQLKKEEKVKGMMGKRTKMEIIDGRKFTGFFHCFDSDGNIILTSACQVKSENGESIRIFEN